VIRLRINVLNVCGQALRNATVAASIDTGHGSPAKSQGMAPFDVLIADQGPTLITLTAKADGYYDEVAQINHDKNNAWTTTNPSITLSIGAKPVPVNVYSGRVRFAPTVQLAESTAAKPNSNAGAAMLDDRPYYRTVWLLSQNWRTWKTGVAADVNGRGWDRFNYVTTDVSMDKYGSWVLLEYGDPPDFGNMRLLIGVWAPFNAGINPPVVVQVTPNTAAPAYPADQFPFTGVYPYGNVVKSASSGKTGQLTVVDFNQPYVELGSNRTLISYGVAYQIYAARSDLFGVGMGPVIITPIPAATSGGTVREPFNCQEGLGRLVGEVLRFLYAQSITAKAGNTGGQLVFANGTTSVQRPDNSPPLSADQSGFPSSCTSTLLGHSAAVATLYDVVKIPTLAALRGGSGSAATANARRAAYFSDAFYGGATPYFTQNWHGLWIVDGVGNPGQIWSPTRGSATAAAWLDWMKQSGGRSLCAVYTPSGIADPLLNGLVSCTVQDSKSGTAGQVVEKKVGLISWLRLSTDYLRATTPQTDTSFLPSFTTPSEPLHPVDTHNEIYHFGVGYAAQAFR
jgi:hypothetical protein